MAKRPTMPTETNPAFLAIDAGTSALKAVLFSQQGQTLATTVQRYRYRTPAPGWAEADPQTWWRALTAALDHLRGQGYDLHALQALGLTGQMHTPVLLDEAGEAVAPAILWLDQRAGAELRELQARLQLPPHQLNASFSLPKLLWLKRHRPQALARTRTLLWPKDYLRFRLTGRRLTDETDAAGAALLDWERREWAEERLALVGLSSQVLPEIAPPTAEAGPLRPEISARLGLSPRLRVIVGAGDVISLLGVAPMQPGRLILILGSSTMLALPASPHLQEDPQHRLHRYPFLPTPILNGIQSTSGAALTWAWQTLRQDDAPFEKSIQQALATPPGAEGLIFLPYLAGERSPYWDDALRAGFFGLTLSHQRSHMLRAVMEGVAFSVRHLIAIARDLGAKVDELALAGGGASVPGWPQIFADICQRPVLSFDGEEAAAHTLFAFMHQARQPDRDLTEILTASLPPARAIFHPNSQLTERYNLAYARFLQLSDFLHATSL